MKFCPVVPEICRGQVHGSWKERRRIRIIIRKIIIRNGAKTISLQTLFGRLNKQRSYNNIEIIQLVFFYFRIEIQAKTNILEQL